jgi:hypothetical protein
MQFMRTRENHDDIVFTGKTTGVELMDLHADAKVFAFASLYETAQSLHQLLQQVTSGAGQKS